MQDRRNPIHLILAIAIGLLVAAIVVALLRQPPEYFDPEAPEEFHRVRPRYREIFSEATIRRADQSLHSYERGDTWFLSAPRLSYHLMRGAFDNWENSFREGRRRVLSTELSRVGNQSGYYFDRYGKIIIRETARMYLSDPETLLRIFEQFEDLIVTLIKFSHHRDDALFYLERHFLPVLEPELGMEVRTAVDTHLAVETDESLQRLHDVADSELNAMGTDVLWRCRREREGGAELVTTWRTIVLRLLERAR